MHSPTRTKSLPVPTRQASPSISVNDDEEGDSDASQSAGELPPGHRYVTAHVPDMDRRRSNKIRTNKYFWYTFIPVIMWEQFSQAANAYFLVVLCLQMIPVISNTGGLPLTAVPLSFVVGVSALKDLYEDYRRKKSDLMENVRSTTILGGNGIEVPASWEDIRPGIVLKVVKGEQLPVDALLLASSIEGGDCFVQTMNLDGETNLKKKTAALTQREWEQVQNESELRLQCEAPSVDLYRFHGAIVTNSFKARGVGIGNLLLRGTELQQTDWVICLAVFCGHDTRAMMNAQMARYKLSKLDSELSKVVYMLFAVQIFICFIFAIAGGIWNARCTTRSWYLEDINTEKANIFVKGMGTWILLTCNTVPISLIVTLTCVKFIQSGFIFSDKACGENLAEVHTSQVIESLGQVTHVFTDKTGTLTMNVMEYKGCSVAGRIYGLQEDGSDFDSNTHPAGLKAPHVDFHDAAFREDLAAAVEAGAGPPGGRPTQLATFLLSHALCHTVEAKVDETLGKDEAAYNASSPDELALVSMSRALGLEFMQRISGVAHLRVTGAALGAALEAACGWRGRSAATSTGGGDLDFELLDVCEFDNERKRMSVVVRCPDGRLMVFVKGADSMVLQNCRDDAATHARIEEHLWCFASRGLRTLAHAARPIAEDEYKDWHARYVNAQKMFSEERTVQVQALAVELETKPLDLLGVTAIEDRLQDQVSETIEQMRAAGIRVWVLTGDKVETAISIALSCRLITEEMTNVVIDGNSSKEVKKKLALAGMGDWPALTISGNSLAVAFETDKLKHKLFEVAEQCCVVVCCRVSPKQKADVVQLVKTYEASAVTLSIGDGANDVSMLVTAHVGVGIAGKEGAQASRTADFAIAEFRLLRRLLFVHGRESYRRMAVLALYNFYKNIVLALPTALTGHAAGFTGVPIFHQWPVQLHNIIYSHAAVCMYGVFDRSKLDSHLLERDSSNWGVRRFSRSAVLVWVAMAVVQAVLYTEIAVRTFGGAASDGGPPMDDIFSLGTIRFAWVVIGVNITMFYRHETWYTWMSAPYAFNFACLVVTEVLTNIEPHGFSRGVLDTVFDRNVLRTLAATGCAMSMHTVIGELFIRWDIQIAEWISWSMRRCAALFRYEAEPSQVPPLRAQVRDLPSKSALEVKVKSPTHGRVKSGVKTDMHTDSLMTTMSEVPSLPELQLPPRIKGLGRNSLRAPTSTGNFGYAYAQECCVERSRDAAILHDDACNPFKRNLDSMRWDKTTSRRHSLASCDPAYIEEARSRGNTITSEKWFRPRSSSVPTLEIEMSMMARERGSTWDFPMDASAPLSRPY